MKYIFRQRCLDFYAKSHKQINQRFDFEDPILINMDLISLKNILNKKCHSLVPLVKIFLNLIAENELWSLDNDRRLLKNTKIDISSDVDVETCFTNIENIHYANETAMFLILSRFVFSLLVYFLLFLSRSYCVLLIKNMKLGFQKLANNKKWNRFAYTEEP